MTLIILAFFVLACAGFIMRTLRSKNQPDTNQPNDINSHLMELFDDDGDWMDLNGNNIR